MKTENKARFVRVSLMFFLITGTAAYFGWFGRWSYVRLFQSVIDLGISIVKYFLTLFFIDADFLPATVAMLPDVPFVPFLPIEKSAFDGFWSRFIALFFDKSHFLTYCSDFILVLIRIYRLLLPFILLILIWKINLSNSAEEDNDDFHVKSKGVLRAERFLSWISPKIEAVLSFFENLPGWYKTVLLLIILSGTNLLTVGVELVSGLLYYSVSPLVDIYTQVYKFFLDLTIGYVTLPLVVWLVVFYLLFSIIRRAIAYNRLESMEGENLRTLEDLPLCVLITGKIGVGKTKMNVNLSLSFQDLFRERMRKKMFEIQAEFPEFPWEDLDVVIGCAFVAGDLPSKAKTRDIFFGISTDLLKTFDYAGKTCFSDGVILHYLEDRIVDYAELQYMYRVQTFICSSYSMRVDHDYLDLGKFPLWSVDYFRSGAYDPYGETYRSHILDFDKLRLGRTVSDQVNAGAWEFGVLSHTEMGKDFGNSITNNGLKASDDKANIKNDMLIERIKILRHSATACHIPFCQYIGDEQRPTSLGADALELTDIIRVMDSSKPKSACYLLLFERFFCDFIFSVWQSWYCTRRVHRADTDLPAWLLRKVVDRLYPWWQEKQQLFGFQEVTCKIIDGSDPDQTDVEPVKIFSCFKKVHAGRYATDCFAGILGTRTKSWSLNDSPTYSGEVATPEEIRKQNSYFGNKILQTRRVEDVGQ